MSDISIPVSKFLRVFDYLQRVGLDVDAAARTVDLSPARLQELPPETLLPAKHYSRLYKACVEQMQELKQPLPWGAGVGSESFELMCHCMIGGRTLGEALQLAQRFGALAWPMLRQKIRLQVDGEAAFLHYDIDFDEETNQLAPKDWDRAGRQGTVARASGLAIWHALCGWLVGESLQTLGASVAAPPINKEYEAGLSAALNCPVEFDARDNAFSFPSRQLERRVVHTADSLREFLDNAVYQLIAIDREPASTSAAIKSLIIIDLPSGLPSFTRVSEHLHMSESSLRRRLQAENTSYQNLKDEVRCQVAIEKLLHEDVKVADLAEYLGFTEPSSFVRSFKGWTGETPRSYREKMHALAAH